MKKKNLQNVDYDDCIGEESDNKPASLFEMNEEEWKKYWRGMPEYIQEDNPPYKTIYLHFRNEEDYNKFCKKYTEFLDSDQTISIKTKSMWYPHLDRDANSLKRWIEE